MLWCCKSCKKLRAGSVPKVAPDFNSIGIDAQGGSLSGPSGPSTSSSWISNLQKAPAVNVMDGDSKTFAMLDGPTASELVPTVAVATSTAAVDSETATPIEEQASPAATPSSSTDCLARDTCPDVSEEPLAGTEKAALAPSESTSIVNVNAGSSAVGVVADPFSSLGNRAVSAAGSAPANASSVADGNRAVGAAGSAPTNVSSARSGVPAAGNALEEAVRLAANSVEKGNLGVELRRSSPKDRYGFVWDAKMMERENVRVIEKVSAGSLCDTWNGNNPGREVRAGDTLTKVNGKSGRLELLSMELSRMYIFCEFRPGAGRTIAVDTGVALGLVSTSSPATPAVGSTCAAQAAPKAAEPVTAEVSLPSNKHPSATPPPPPPLSGKSPSPAATPPQTPVGANLEPGNYEVRLARSGGAIKWGFIWDAQALEKRSVRRIERITAGSVASEWNRCNPRLDVRPGDELIKVNGKSGRMEMMTMELNRQQVTCEFKPAEPRTMPAGTSSPVALGATTAVAATVEAVADAVVAPVAQAISPIAPADTMQAPLDLAESSTLVSQRDTADEFAETSLGAEEDLCTDAFDLAEKAVASGLATLASETEPSATSLSMPTHADVELVAPMQKAPVVAPLDDTPPGHRRVDLRRSSPVEKWGFIWDAQAMDKQGVRVLDKVSVKSLAADWNQANPELEVRRGDTLVKVNGKTGGLEVHGVELSRNNIVICEFRLGESRTPKTTGNSASVPAPAPAAAVTKGVAAAPQTPKPPRTRSPAPLAPLSAPHALAPLQVTTAAGGNAAAARWGATNKLGRGAPALAAPAPPTPLAVVVGKSKEEGTQDWVVDESPQPIF